jgi:flagellar biosynthesis/type III secretory pathway protein FliH
LANPRSAADHEVKPALFPLFQLAPDLPPPPPSPPPPRYEAVERAPLTLEDTTALREHARGEGFAVGIAEGRAAAHAEWTERLAALAAALERAARELEAQRVELAAEVDRQLPRAVFSLCRRILHAELSVADTATRTIIRSLSGRLSGLESAMAVRLSPQMLEAFEAWHRSAAAQPSGASFRVEPDPGLGPGEWLVETRDGFLDGRIESQLEEAWKLVAELAP